MAEAKEEHKCSYCGNPAVGKLQLYQYTPNVNREETPEEIPYGGPIYYCNEHGGFAEQDIVPHVRIERFEMEGE